MPAMRLIGNAYAALVVSISATQLALADTQIPDQFHGSWQITTQHQPPTCLEIDADIRITVQASRIDLHEGRCIVQSADPRDEKTFHLKAACAEEDANWDANDEWSIETRGSDTFLTITSLTAPEPYKVFYGLCTAHNTATEGFDPDQDLCYRNDLSRMALRPSGNVSADIELEATFNRHICWIHGPVTRTGTGYLYEATLENGTQCELAVSIAADGGVSFEDKNQNCRNFHCGARASFEDIEIPASARQQCQ